MYFDKCKTLDELKKEYRRLAMKHHPDMGGDTETMKRINDEHDRVFEILKAAQNRAAAADTSGKTKATTEAPHEFRDIIDFLLHLDGLTVELCGAWLWIGGDTRKHKEALKGAGCRWSNNKKLWYWRHEEDGYTWHKKGRKYSIDDIRAKYGSTEFNAEHNTRARIANA